MQRGKRAGDCVAGAHGPRVSVRTHLSAGIFFRLQSQGITLCRASLRSYGELLIAERSLNITLRRIRSRYAACAKRENATVLETDQTLKVVSGIGDVVIANNASSVKSSADDSLPSIQSLRKNPARATRDFFRSSSFTHQLSPDVSSSQIKLQAVSSSSGEVAINFFSDVRESLIALNSSFEGHCEFTDNLEANDARSYFYFAKNASKDFVDRRTIGTFARARISACTSGFELPYGRTAFALDLPPPLRLEPATRRNYLAR